MKDTGKSAATTTPPWSKRNAKDETKDATDSTKDADKTPANGTQKDAKLQSREIKVPVATQRKTSTNEPTNKPKAKEVKPPPPPESSSSEYETDSDEEDESDSAESIDDELKNKLPIAVKLKPVERPSKVEKSPSGVDRAGKFIKPALKKVPTLDKLNKQKPPSASIIPEQTSLRPVPKPIEIPEKKDEEKVFVRPPLRKVDSTTKRRKFTFHVA